MTGRRRIVENPFYVLGLAPEAGRAEIEQQGQKLLAMLELGLEGVATYATPLGPAKRTAEDVRRALAELRDPARRLEHELWAQLLPAAAPRVEERTPATWPEARAALGWKG